MKKRIVIFTDLDGTLIDHETYSFGAARQALEKIRELEIVLVLNSSKTLAEMHPLRYKLQLNAPLICENGALIAYPLAEMPPTSPEYNAKDYRIDFSGKNYHECTKIIHRLREEKRYAFTGFSDMSADEVAECTGLSTDEAAAAKQRLSTEPLTWEDSEERLQIFKEELARHELTLTRGGRFYHVGTKSSKGKALKKMLGTLSYRAITIGAGDAENDRSMLESVDYPVIIPAHSGKILQIDHPRKRVAKHEGPRGWNESILHILKTLQEEVTNHG